jgi:sulfate transport system permease protein
VAARAVTAAPSPAETGTRAARRSRVADRHAPWLIRGAFATYVSVLVALPLLTLVVRGLSQGPAAAWDAITAPAAVSALGLSVGTGLVAAIVNGIAGTAIAWVLVRWDVPGRRLLSALVDLPLSIPTLVAGILLVALYGPQTGLGRALVAEGLPIAYARPGIVLALLFVTLPFVVRAVEPVLLELDPAEEEAATTLGAGRWLTFRHVLLPPLLPAVAAGTVQVFARSVAEFGSLAAVSGNIPFRTLTAPVYVLGEVEGGAPAAAAAVSLVLLAFAFVLQPLSHALARAAGSRRG